MLGFPRGDLRRELRIVVGQTTELPQHVVLARARCLRNDRRRRQELARWIRATFDLQNAVHDAVGYDLE
jgi:hypothetical protein